MTTLLPLSASTAYSITIPPLQPWELSKLSTFSPSGYPGSLPYSSIYATISDPNTIPLGKTRFGDASFPPSAVNCSLRWVGFNAVEEPWNIITPCTGSLNHGRWTMQMLKPTNNATAGYKPSGTTNFALKFTLEESMMMNNATLISLVFEAEKRFAVPDNMSGVCGGSGVCSWGLKDGLGVVLVEQVLKETRCLMGDCY
ncbi:hypothetical protein B0H66DRAFT_604863 [Apodospora peruviana]|uniref:Uncharacterized protein n=1 Tax=Apodospora peruviana TaxID=516989 RepID=A0AAE0M2P8_9PEZI|nr:hypothetical protein B0H66DRAFT_604863 [Apodospora peruviana]